MKYARTPTGIVLLDFNVELSIDSKCRLIYFCRGERNTVALTEYLTAHAADIIKVLADGTPCTRPMCRHTDWWWHREGAWVCRVCYPPTMPEFEIAPPIEAAREENGEL